MGQNYRTYNKRLLYHHGNGCHLPSQFIFVWVHVTEGGKTGDITSNENIREHSNNHSAAEKLKAFKGSLGSESVCLFFSLFNTSWF